MDSILTSIKKLLGIEENYTHFDSDIVTYINGVLMVLNQVGFGPEAGFFITDKTKTWAEFLGTRKDIEGIKTYIYLKVKIIFDPPTSSFVLESIKEQIREFEWRLNIQVDTPVPEEGGV